MTNNNDNRPRLTPIDANPDDARRIAREEDAARAVEPLQVRIGRHFSHNEHERFRFNHTTGKWMHWTGLRWRVDETNFALDQMMTFTHHLRMMDPQNRRALGQVGYNKSCLEAASVDPAMAQVADDFDRDPRLVGTPTGYIDLSTGTHHAPDPHKMISLATGVSPTEAATCPKWVEFLTWACNDDADLVRYLQKFFGYCLSGLMNEEVMTFIYGPGGNGKGVMLSVLGRVMGEYYLSTPASTFMATRHQEHATELARLQHRRLVSASETNEDDKWNMSRIKEITGNENPISARFMRQDFFEFWPVCKLLIIGNSKPSFDDIDAAIARRLRLIEFTRTPAHVNRKLKEEFNGEFGGILRWVIDGFRMYEAEGMEPPDVIRRASQQYLGSQDVVQQFISDWTEMRGAGVLLKADIGMALSLYCRQNGIPRKVPATRVYKRLEESMPTLEWGDAVRYENKRCYRGINLTEDAWMAIMKELRKGGKDLDAVDPARNIRDHGQGQQ